MRIASSRSDHPVASARVGGAARTLEVVVLVVREDAEVEVLSCKASAESAGWRCQDALRGIHGTESAEPLLACGRGRCASLHEARRCAMSSARARRAHWNSACLVKMLPSSATRTERAHALSLAYDPVLAVVVAEMLAALAGFAALASLCGVSSGTVKQSGTASLLQSRVQPCSSSEQRTAAHLRPAVPLRLLA